MTIRPFVTDSEYEITDSEALKGLTEELRNLIDDMDLTRLQQDRLNELIEDQEREAMTLAFVYGIRAGDAFAHVVGRLRRRDGRKALTNARKPAPTSEPGDGKQYPCKQKRR